MRGGTNSAGRDLNVFTNVHSTLSIPMCAAIHKLLTCSQIPGLNRRGSEASGYFLDLFRLPKANVRNQHLTHKMTLKT